MTTSSYPVAYQIPYDRVVTRDLVAIPERVAERACDAPNSVRIAKRVIDVVVATLGLLLVSWLFPIIALLIYVDSPGPILYRQRRAGAVRFGERGGTPKIVEFDMFKFRTMIPDAERHTGVVLAQEGDPRVTRVGRFLRKTRLDELPQLVNVLRGEMSLVGPRPERRELFEQLSQAIPFFEERMRGVKPGITGFAQVSLAYTGRPLADSPIAAHFDALTNPFHIEEARGATADDMRIKLLYDLAYVAALENFRSFLFTELSIIVKTPLVMLRGLGR